MNGNHCGLARVLRALTLGLMLLPWAGASAATTITYMFSGTATTTFGAGTIAMFGAVGDPSKVVAGAVRCNDLTQVAIVLSGNQQADVYTPMSIFVNNASGYAGLRTGTCASAGADWFRVNAAQFGGWDLASPIGPFMDVPTYANSSLNISTSWGNMVLYSQSLTEFDAFVTQAPLAAAVSVPTLSEWALVALLAAVGALGAGVLRRPGA